jgi:uncharacterized protein YegL
MPYNETADFLPDATEMAHKQTPAVIIKDLSMSMKGLTPQGQRKIDALMAASSQLKPLGISNPKLRDTGDVLILGFPGRNGMAADVIADWGKFDALPTLTVPEELMAGSPMASALEVALDQLDSRLQHYRNIMVKANCPHIFCMTDGFGTEGRAAQIAVGRKIQERVAKRQLKFELLFIEHEDPVFQQSVLNELGQDFGVEPRVVDPSEFEKLFVWFTMTMSQAAAGKGAQRGAGNDHTFD